VIGPRPVRKQIICNTEVYNNDQACKLVFLAKELLFPIHKMAGKVVP